MRAFLVAIASFVALLAVVSAGASKDTRTRCIPGQSNSMNCNRCKCSGGFPLLCTKKNCPDQTCIHGKMKRSSESKAKETTKNTDDRIREFLREVWGRVHLVGSK